MKVLLTVYCAVPSRVLFIKFRLIYENSVYRYR
jgi:hypothetical protein